RAAGDRLRARRPGAGRCARLRGGRQLVARHRRRGAARRPGRRRLPARHRRRRPVGRRGARRRAHRRSLAVGRRARRAPVAPALDTILDAWWRVIEGGGFDLSLTGSARFADPDADLAIDSLGASEPGTWAAEVKLGGGSTADLAATWTGRSAIP